MVLKIFTYVRIVLQAEHELIPYFELYQKQFLPKEVVVLQQVFDIPIELF